MRRRAFLALAAAGLGVRTATTLAQQETRKGSRIGYLGTGLPNRALMGAFQQGLRDLGWAEGQNLVIEYRFAEGQLERLPRLAAELVGLDVQVIAASPTPAALAAKAASDVIPIVGISFDNPVEHGLIQSLARPGGNVTGLAYSVGPEIFAKDLELLRELVPEVRKVAVLSGPTRNVNHGLMLQNVAGAARAMGARALVRRSHDAARRFGSSFRRYGKGAGRSAFRLRRSCVRCSCRPACGPRGAISTAGDVYEPAVCRSRRPHVLCARFSRDLAARSGLRRQNTERRVPGRSAGRAANQISARAQSQDGQIPWPDDPADAPRPLRRGD